MESRHASAGDSAASNVPLHRARARDARSGRWAPAFAAKAKASGVTVR